MKEQTAIEKALNEACQRCPSKSTFGPCMSVASGQTMCNTQTTARAEYADLLAERERNRKALEAADAIVSAPLPTPADWGVPDRISQAEARRANLERLFGIYRAARNPAEAGRG